MHKNKLLTISSLYAILASMPNKYELALLISAKFPQEKQKKILDEVKKYIMDLKGALGEVKLFGKRNLHYPIKRETEGIYHIAQLELDSKSMSLLSSKLKLNEDILRFLLIRR